MERVRVSDGIEIALHRFDGEPGGRPITGALPPVMLHHGFAADTRLNWVAPGAASLDRRIRRMVIGGIGGAVVEAARGETRFDGGGLAAAMRADDPSTITHPMARAFRAFPESTGADRFALAAQAETVGRRQPIDTGAITATALVLVGDRDDLAVRPEALAAAVGGAELRIVPGDHLGAVAAPEFAPAIVEFLGRP